MTAPKRNSYLVVSNLCRHHDLQWTVVLSGLLNQQHRTIDYFLRLLQATAINPILVNFTTIFTQFSPQSYRIWIPGCWGQLV